MNEISRKSVTIRKKMFVVALSMLLTLAAGCHPDGNRFADMTPQTILAPDSLWTPTGDAKLDSLLQLAAVAPQDTNLARKYKQIADLYYYASDQLKAKEYYLKLKALSEKINWSTGIFLYTPRYAELLSRQGMMDSSIVILKQALELAKKEMDETQIAKMSMNIGISYYQKQWYETALDYYFQVLPIYEGKNDKFSLAHLYSALGLTYSSMHMHEE